MSSSYRSNSNRKLRPAKIEDIQMAEPIRFVNDREREESSSNSSSVKSNSSIVNILNQKIGEPRGVLNESAKPF